jgi:chromosome segregation ATPase
LEISQPERIDINAPTVNWTEAENLTRDRAQAIEQLTNTIKADEEAFCQREREFLNSSTNFISEFKRANGNFISQETQLANKLEQELARLTSQQQTNTRDIETHRQTIETLNRDIQAATERLATTTNDRATIIGNINAAELAKLKPKTAEDASHDIFRWIHEVAYGQGRDTYAYKTYLTNYKANKGNDFLNKLREVNPANISADQFAAGRNIYTLKDTFVNDLAKGKQTSLAHLLDYINSVTSVEETVTELNANRRRLEETTNEVAKLTTEIHNIPTEVKLLQAKIEDSRHYINTLNKLESVFANATRITEDRARVQDQYLDSLRGDAQAAEHLVRSNSPVHRQPTEPREETQPRVDNQYAEEYSSQQENREEATKEGRFQPQEETNFAGDHETHTKKAEVRQAVPATDLKESQFANSKTGSCESCSIF